MNVLIASLATPGFVFPSIAVAERLRARGHDVAFVTDTSFARAIEQRGFARIARGTPDGHSFEIDGWADPYRIAMQTKHLLAALTVFRPDVILASNLAMGPLIVRLTHRIPVAVLGSVVLLWPSLRTAASSEPAVDARLAWRYADQLRHLERACAALGVALASEPYERSPLFGDRFLLQGVPELQRDAALLPAPVRFTGSCALDEIDVAGDDAAAWLRAQRARGRRILYVQLGRVFEAPSFWRIFRDWIARRGAAAVVCAERHDRPIDDVPETVLLRKRVPQDAVLPYADAVVCTGHPTAVLGALAHGVPLVVSPAGSGTEEIAEACCRNGAALSPPSGAADERAFVAMLDRLLDEPSYRAAARRLQARMEKTDGPAAVCRDLEALVDERGAGTEPDAVRERGAVVAGRA